MGAENTAGRDARRTPPERSPGSRKSAASQRPRPASWARRLRGAAGASAAGREDHEAAHQGHRPDEPAHDRVRHYQSAPAHAPSSLRNEVRGRPAARAAALRLPELSRSSSRARSERQALRELAAVAPERAIDVLGADAAIARRSRRRRGRGRFAARARCPASRERRAAHGRGGRERARPDLRRELAQQLARDDRRCRRAARAAGARARRSTRAGGTGRAGTRPRSPAARAARASPPRRARRPGARYPRRRRAGPRTRRARAGSWAAPRAASRRSRRGTAFRPPPRRTRPRAGRARR